MPNQPSPIPGFTGPGRPVRVRIAPSPTGDPHIGTAYMAVFNSLFAKRFGGEFIIRIEDTDRSRFRPGSEESLLEALRWLGLQWNEGPDKGGPDTVGPYRQSERLGIYRKYAEQLVEQKKAYPCFCTAERLAQLRESQKDSGQTGYDGHCRGLSTSETISRIKDGQAHVIRLATPNDGETIVKDLLRGEIPFENKLVDDQVLLKSDGFPTYHLAVVVDDHLMNISHVIRGEEWITSTPKHIMLYEAFGWELPVYIHLPLLRNADKSKISKRKNPTNILYYRRKGILPEALINFLALMGYHPEGESEKMSFDAIAAGFDPAKIHLGGPVFDQEKLAWLNGLYLREMTNEKYEEALRQLFLGPEYFSRVVPLLKERVETLDQFFSKGDFFFSGSLTVQLEDLVPKKGDPKEVSNAMGLVLDAFDSLDTWSTEGIQCMLDRVLADHGLKPKDVLMPVRIATTGRKDSPPLAETLAVLGKEIVRKRLRDAIVTLKSPA